MKAEYVWHKPEMCDKCSSKVRPAAILPEAAKQNGAYLIEVNPEETLLSHYCDESHRGKSGESWLHLIEL